MELTKIKKAIIGAAAILGAVVTIGAYVVKPISWYKEHKAEKLAKEKSELKEFIIDVYGEVSNGIIEETTREISRTKVLLDSLQSVINYMQEGSQYFAIGYRGDGSGKLWYRDVFGKVYDIYHYPETNQYYYINEEGRAVYL